MNKTLDEMKMIHEEEMQSYGRIQDRVISVMLSHGCKIVQTPSFEDYDSYGTYFPSLRKESSTSVPLATGPAAGFAAGVSVLADGTTLFLRG